MKQKPELVTAASKSGMTCAHIAANNGSEAVIKQLMVFNKSLVTSVKNTVNESLPLHLAVAASHEDVVKILIDAGSSAIAENQEGMTAIHLASREGDMEVLEAIMKSAATSALSTKSSKNGLGPLHVAAFYGKSEIVRELQSRVDINSRTDTPQVANVIGDSELKLIITMDYGLTPLHMASFMGRENVVRLILNNSSVNTEAKSLGLERVPIFYAAANGHLVVLSLLLSRSGKHLTSVDRLGRQPLHLAAENGHGDMVATLLGQGAQLDAADGEGWTPLHFATKNGYQSVVQLLLESGASPTAKTANGQTPIMLAAAGDHVDLLYFLLNKPHSSLELVEDKTFLMDLMLCGLSKEFETIEEFVLHSPAPLFTVTLLSRLYRELAFREKERAKDLNDVGRFCELMSTKLLGIASTIARPSDILRSTDAKGGQFLDMLLESGMKRVVEAPSVQRYLSDIWSGHLASWSSSQLFLLFLSFLCFPPVMIFFCSPLKTIHSFYHIPVIKFLAMIVSNFYLIGIITIIAAVPLDPALDRPDFYPIWYEYACLAWIGGMLVTELTKSGAASGLGVFRYGIIFFGVVASVFQIVAIATE